MNGFSVCNKLKKDANLKDVPLIIMSSESSDETFEQHKKLRTRAEDYVHKPIAFGELLRHIQGFVQLGAAPQAADVDAAIVIDDEIEINNNDYMSDDDGTQINPRPPVMPNPAPARAMETVDADVDAFADAAFGRLTGSEPPGAGGAVAEARPIHNGAPESIPSPTAPKRPTAAPVSARVPSVRPPTGVDIAEYEKIREDLVRTREKANALQTQLHDTRNEVDKLRMEVAETERLAREVDELKVKLATGAPKAGGISSREFLDLREALNRKDKEILGLKEQLSRKDKESVEAQDRMLALERARADLDDRSLATERELAEVKEKNEALAADKEMAKKASEDFKARYEKARAEADGKERQIGDLKVHHAEELASSEARNSALQSELDQTLANERAEHARALDQAEDRRRAEVDQGRRDREAALAEAREQADRERHEALSAQSAHLKDEHRQELEKTEKHHGDTLAALRAEHADQTRALENDRDARITAIESRLGRELSETNDKLAKADMDLSATRGELSSLREAKESGDAAHDAAMGDVQRRLSEVTELRDDLAKKHLAVSERAAALEADLASARTELGETKSRLVGESSRADKAQAKWEADRQSLERAKDALAVALAQIEEAEGRPIS
jgi:CheY-like chemotaxis protein